MTTAEHPDSPVDVAEADRRARTAAALEAAAQARTAAERRRALDLLVVSNVTVADSVANRYRGRGIDLEDLQQVAYTALVKASRRFDPTRGQDFLAFAVPTIKGEIKRHFRDLGWMVRPPRRLQELQAAVLRHRAQLVSDLGRPPTAAEIATGLGEDPADVEEVLAMAGCFRSVSLEAPIGTEGGTLADWLPEENDDEFTGVELRADLARALRALTARERRIVTLRFHDDCTQAEIGERLGLTQSQVSRILQGAYRKLRVELEPTDTTAA